MSEQIVELETDLDATTAERFAEACRFDGLHVEAVVFSFRSIRDVPAQRNRLLIRQQDLPAAQARLPVWRCPTDTPPTRSGSYSSFGRS